MNGSERIFCAFDVSGLDGALSLAKTLKGKIGGIKLGLEFFSAEGPSGIRKMAEVGLPIFLDLKLHDIPNTVAKAVHALGPLGASMLTVHTGGGVAMMKAARDASLEAADKAGVKAPLLLGVTVLTSLDDGDLDQLGVENTTIDHALRLAGLAKEAGLGGVVCSPFEVPHMKEAFGGDLKLVVPGIRPEGADKGDQKRVMSPRQAVERGADYLVIGRAITGALDPASAAGQIAESLADL